jgi:biopolymer transport protein ExbB
MKLLRRSFILIGSCLIATGVAADIPASLDELLHQVRQTGAAEEVVNREREQRFLAEKDAQEQLLQKTRQALAVEQQRSEKLRRDFEQNQAQIAALEAKLLARSGTLLELFGVVRQVAGDTEALLQDSLVSTQIPGRSEALAKLAGSDSLPSIEQLETLWFALQQEMTESGKVVRYPARVIGSEGDERETEVTRLGVFNVVSSGSFLRHLPESGKLQELPRQPAERYQEMASALEQAGSGLQPMVVDPSRGAVLDLLLQTPDLMERIQQGKLVGYVIIAIAVIGLLIALERGVRLVHVGRKIRRQLKSDTPDLSNPLGRVMRVYRDNPDLSPETLELKMDESILKDSSTLQRGLPTLKILAAIAPLLGLLGTVTGLIETFQSITLFGTGDPGLMAGGISQALVTTVLGLTAAIPLILLHSMLNSQSRRLFSLLEEQSAGIIAQHAEREERNAALA